jgi:hypothetical protein
VPTLLPCLELTPEPTLAPAAVPTFYPTATPTAVPTVAPTPQPSTKPTTKPTASPTLTPSCVPTVLPTASPTQTPTVAPTRIPTRVPTAVPSATPTTVLTVTPTASLTAAPTRSPSTQPTVAQTDCRSACSFYTAGATDISTEHLIAEIQLPENFGISVEVKLGEVWKSGSHNILQIRDKSNAQQILRISVGASNNLRMSYGVTTYVGDGGPTLVTNYNETFTTIKFAYAFGQLALQSLAAPATSYYGSITTAPFDTSSKVFQVYASGTAGDYPTAGGTLKNLFIQCKLSVLRLSRRSPVALNVVASFVNVYTALTPTPSAAPTTVPSAAQTTFKPSTARPSFAATTDCRSACSFGYNTPIIIKSSQNIADVLLSDDFEVIFDVKLNALAPSTGNGYENIMEIADRSDYTALIRIHITQTTNLRVSYNNNGYITSGPYLNANYSGIYTKVRFAYHNGTVSLWTSASQATESHSVDVVKPTAGNVYMVSVSGVSTHAVNPWGFVRNMVVRGKSFVET